MERGEQYVGIELCQAAVVLLTRAFKPCKCFVSLTAPRKNVRNLTGKALSALGDSTLESPLRLLLVAQ